ncbi:MAG: rhodanese-like domain-containing protein [Thermodesulfobacteriota bacterium]
MATLIASSKISVLDVRPNNFSRNNHFLKNSRHIPLLYLEEMVAQLPKKTPILITDWAMKQSTIAAKFLITKGYEVEGVLKGGIERWKQENRPVAQKEPRSFAGTGNRDFK